MNRSSSLCSWTLAILLPLTQPVHSQEPPAPQQQQPATPSPEDQAKAVPFKSEELEQIVAPIALYPDALLAQVLMASTYPLEIVLAARWSKEHPDIKGDAVAKAVENETWDASVKSMVAFPDVLTMMNEKLDWTQKLGDAVLAQRKDVMDAVQRLRVKAKDAGNLKSSKEQTVKTEAAPAGSSAQQVIIIESPSPEVVYVPTYNPTVVYGAWPYPAYPPYYYYPPGYAAGAAFFSFSAGVIVGGALWGGFNWGHSDIDINVNRYNNFNRNSNLNVNNRTNVSNRWEHNSAHRQGVGYRDSATQQRYGRGSSQEALQARENYRGRSGNEYRDLGGGGESRDLANRASENRDLGAGAESRDLANRGDEYRDLGGGAESRDLGNRTNEYRDLGGGGENRDLGNRDLGGASSGRSPDAFRGVDNGARTRAHSSRGMASRGGMSRGGGRRR
ncbi:DUF3300 domain-containing protein [Peristeroidobacter agariperforans]|uniref:DUF3300 domain-containing protein n=1 Tax=Peristeroidobacter agariperforans TaxID=268404 RepID=UPI0018E4E364|nr:DUF3300 domain-containing protein [Peristeroidobacter agariperforans]